MKAEIKMLPVTGIIIRKDVNTLLEPGELGCMLDWRVWDPRNGDIKEEKTVKSQSFLTAFIATLMLKMASTQNSADALSITDTGGVARNVWENYYATSVTLLNMVAAAAQVLTGIIIGTGNTAPTITDDSIETIIPHATMNYSIQSFAAPASDATTSQVTITRSFSNVSGGAVTVNEIALYNNHWDGAFRYYCLIRDVIAGGIAVPNGQTLTVNYRPQAVV